MKVVVTVVAMVTLLCSVALAQDIETTMAGRAQIGAGLLSEAWLQNPAVLGLTAPANGMAHDGSWRNSAVGLYEVEGDVDLRSISWGGKPADGQWGVGAGWVDVVGMEDVGLGVGVGSADGRYAVGVNYQSTDVPMAGSLDIFDVAVAVRSLDLGGSFTEGILGLVVRDITDEGTTTYDVGVGVESADWRLALDFEDITDESDSVVQCGAVRTFGAQREWQVGAGLDDGDLTAGVVYHAPTADGGPAWKLGVAFIAGDDGASDAWVVGAGADW